MVEFLTTNGISYNIENIITGAKSKLLLVSPYLKLSKTFYERLKDASNQNIPIRIIYGKKELEPNEMNSLTELKNVKLFYFENLHAKCYFNETKMVITSMNMYDFSEKNNREMGILIDSNIDKDLFNKAAAEIDSILQSSTPIKLKETYREPENVKTTRRERINRGYCIRCQRPIDNNPNMPFCGECFSVWAQFENPDYQENFCLCCGKPEMTSLRRPLCYNCYTKYL